MNRKAVTKPQGEERGGAGWTFPRVILFLPLTKAGGWGAGTQCLAHRAPSPEKGLGGKVPHLTQKKLPNMPLSQGSKCQEDGVSGFSLHKPLLLVLK